MKLDEMTARVNFAIYYFYCSNNFSVLVSNLSCLAMLRSLTMFASVPFKSFVFYITVKKDNKLKQWNKKLNSFDKCVSSVCFLMRCWWSPCLFDLTNSQCWTPVRSSQISPLSW